MLNLFSMSSFVQFVGAFNFANVYKPIQDNLFHYFLNVDEKFAKHFGEITEKVQADIQSVSSMEAIVTDKGKSTQSSVDKVKYELSRLREEGWEVETQTKNEIKSRYSMGFSRPMFMSFGLYCAFELWVFGMMDALKSFFIYSSFAYYTIAMWVVLLYFISCELIKTFVKKEVCRAFRPTHWGMMIVTIAIAVFAFLNYFTVESFGSCVKLPYSAIETICASSIVLSIMPFVVVMSLTCLHYWLASRLIKEKAESLKDRHKSIHAEKQRLDAVQAVFSNDGNGWDFDFE